MANFYFCQPVFLILDFGLIFMGSIYMILFVFQDKHILSTQLQLLFCNWFLIHQNFKKIEHDW